MRYVYAVFVPEDSGLDRLYSTASKAIKRLKQYGVVNRGAVAALHRGEIVYNADDEASQSHATRLPVN